MPLELPKSDMVGEGAQEVRKGIGYTYTISVAARTSSTVTSSTITVVRDVDETDVTSDFIPSGSTSNSTTTVTTPEIVAPSAAQKGKYIITCEYEAGVFSPDRPYIIWHVMD